MSKPPSTETQLKTTRRDNRRLRDANFRMEQDRISDRHRIMSLESQVREAESTIATLRRAVDALTTKIEGR